MYPVHIYTQPSHACLAQPKKGASSHMINPQNTLAGPHVCICHAAHVCCKAINLPCPQSDQCHIHYVSVPGASP